MKKKYSLKCVLISGVFGFAAAVCAAVMVFQLLITPKTSGNPYDPKLHEIRALIDEYYVGEIDDDVIPDFLAAGYVSALGDKYSGYVTADMAEESINSLRGVNSGIGVLVSCHPDRKTMFVIDVHSGSPADKAGLLPGDEITYVDDISVPDDGYETALSHIRSLPDGTSVHIKLMREKREGEVDIVIVHYDSQSVFYKMIDKTAYIKITEFNDLTVKQFTDAVGSAIENEAAGVVFDLRGNGGGTVDSVCKMLDYLLPEGVILEVKYKDESNNETYMSDKNGIDIPMAILTDESTASASEIFSQNMKDYKKAITVGRKTFGKGVVQRTFTLIDGSLLRFTVAKYYTANGSCLDGIGVSPDIETEWSDEELRYRYVNGIENDKDFITACKYLGTDQLS